MPLNTSPRQRRKGFINSVELLLFAPIAVVILLAMVEFCFLLVMQSRLAVSSREGARVAATGGTVQEVQMAVGRVLGRKAMCHAQIQIRPPISERNPPLPGQPVVVLVEVPTRQVIPDLLGLFCSKKKTHTIIGRTVMRAE